MYYEVVLLLKTNKERNKELQLTKDILLNIDKEKLLNINYIGNRKLAYKIYKENYACYVILTIVKDINAIKTIKKNITNNSGKVLRYIVLKVSKIDKNKIY
ncbi:30S ribosomal protein S6 [Candidatus Vidania fulgoroideae]|uniref:Small ribosomal subunit protein bS6 n=1 Tax=Candidatus Vidania fulgoroideorum TaxID=881286 RepID=A0A974X7L8_9PROT|nr:30S ribosomal protein S6 [Candidatus Vidania fulgoroideae]